MIFKDKFCVVWNYIQVCCRLPCLKHCLHSFILWSFTYAIQFYTCHFYTNVNNWCFFSFWRSSWASLAIKKLNCIWWFVHKPHLISFLGTEYQLAWKWFRKELFPSICLVSMTVTCLWVLIFLNCLNSYCSGFCCAVEYLEASEHLKVALRTV